MVKLIKAYNDGPSVIFELSSVATSKKAAKLKASVYLFGRFPSNITGIQYIRAHTMSKGLFQEYRVEIKILPTDGLKDKLKIKEAVDWVADNI